MLREAIEQQSNIRFDRAHFKGFTPTSLEFEIVYFVLSPDYNQYMDIQQAINLQLYERFTAAGLKFAQPTPPVTVQAAQPASKADQPEETKSS
jgi:small-conductance mechanosensitive channel